MAKFIGMTWTEDWGEDGYRVFAKALDGTTGFSGLVACGLCKRYAEALASALSMKARGSHWPESRLQVDELLAELLAEPIDCGRMGGADD